VEVVTGTFDDGTTRPVVVERDEGSRSGRVMLPTEPPERTEPTIRKIAEPIALTAVETERSFRLWRKQLSAKRPSSTDVRVRLAAGQVFRSMRRFTLLRHRPAAGRVKARARAAPRRSSGTTAARNCDRPRKPDDDVEDAQRRCPRCGGVAQPIPGSGLWTCDDCLRDNWERMVAHELGRVIAEVDAITREAAA
jgi:hypothetical protein